LAVQILSKLPKLEELKRGGYYTYNRMSVDELSAVSGTLISLTCEGGFNLPEQADIPLLQFPRLENVDVWCKNASDLQFIATLLENSIPSSGHGLLKKLELVHPPAVPSISFADTEQLLKMSLTKVIKVSTWFYNCSGFTRIEHVDFAFLSIIFLSQFR
jgi:hypothetical protein